VRPQKKSKDLVNALNPSLCDLGWNGLGFLTDKSKEDVDRMKLRELKHARLGMLAFGGVVTQAAMGSESFPYFPA
jgi:hypothetical protein